MAHSSHSKSPFSRSDRVAKALAKEIGLILANELSDPRLDNQVISVTEVELSPDLTHARVFLSILAEADRQNELMTLLMEHTSKIRKAVGQRVRLRHTPEIVLQLDRSLERGVRVTGLLDQIARGEV